MMALVRHLASRLVVRLREQGAARESGQAMIEFAMILAGVSLVTIISIGFLGSKFSYVFNTIARSLP